MRRLPTLLNTLLLSAGLTAAQSAAPLQTTAQTSATQARTLTVYSTVGSAVTTAVTRDFTARTGIQVTVRTGPLPADLSGLDVLWLNDTTTRPAPDLLTALPATLREKSSLSLGPQWLATHARAHTLAYSRDRVQANTLPTTLLDLPRHPELRGRVGWAVGSPAFTDLTAALLATRGEAATRAWLTGMSALNPRDYGSEVSAMTQAIQDGDIDVALTTHPLVQRTRGAGYRVAWAWMTSGDPGNLLEVGGAAIPRRAPHPTAARAFLNALAGAQTGLYLYSATFDQPLTTGPLTPGGMLPESLTTLTNPDRAAQQTRARDLLIELDLY